MVSGSLVPPQPAGLAHVGQSKALALLVPTAPGFGTMPARGPKCPCKPLASFNAFGTQYYKQRF